MEISYDCLYCRTKNYTNDTHIQDDYAICEKCGGIHDIEINDDGEVIIEMF